jgi:hypothetical protein
LGRACGTNGDEKEMYTKPVRKPDWKRLISIKLLQLLLLLPIITQACDNEKGTCMLIDVAISGDRNVT